MLDGFRRRFSPAERTVAGDKNGRHLKRVQTSFEPFGDHPSGGSFVVFLNFFFPQKARNGDRAVEIIGVGRAEARDLPAGLGEDRRIFAVSMGDAPDVPKAL